MIPKSFAWHDTQAFGGGPMALSPAPVMDSNPREMVADQLIEFADDPTPLQKEQNIIVNKCELSLFSIDVSPWDNREIMGKLLANRRPGDRIKSVFCDEEEPKLLFLEAPDEVDIRDWLTRVPECVRCVPVPESPVRFCNYTRLLQVRVGKMVRIVGEEFDGDYGQIVDVLKSKKKVLVKIRPRIDYDGLRQNFMNSQLKLNAHMSVRYRAPQVLYDKAVLVGLGAEIASRVRVIGKKAFPLEVWDGKEFYGKFQYAEIPMFHVSLHFGVVPESEMELFQTNVFGLESDILRIDGYVVKGAKKSQKRKLFPALDEILDVEDEAPAPKVEHEELPILPDLDTPTKGGPVIDSDSDNSDIKEIPQTLQPPPEIDEAEEELPERPLPEPGDRVVPMYGPFASVPCIVERVENGMIVAQADDNPMFWMHRPKDLKILTPKTAEQPKLVTKGIQTNDSEAVDGKARPMSRMHRRNKTAATQDQETACDLCNYILRQRAGDLAQLKNGTVVCVISEKECVDAKNKKHPNSEIDRNAEVFDDIAYTDVRGNRVNIGETVHIGDTNKGKTGKVVHMKDNVFFVQVEKQIVAALPTSTMLEMNCQDVIHDEITFLTATGSFSEPHTIISMDTTGKVLVRGKRQTATTNLDEYGKTWNFASIGVSHHH